MKIDMAVVSNKFRFGFFAAGATLNLKVSLHDSGTSPTLSQVLKSASKES